MEIASGGDGTFELLLYSMYNMQNILLEQAHDELLDFYDQPHLDPNTYSNYRDVSVTHTDIEWEVHFETRQLIGM